MRLITAVSIRLFQSTAYAHSYQPRLSAINEAPAAIYLAAGGNFTGPCTQLIHVPSTDVPGREVCCVTML